MSVRVTTSADRLGWIRPTENWKSSEVKLGRQEDFHVDENFYVDVKDLLKPVTDSTTVRKGR
jgi:hypothetical protein